MEEIEFEFNLLYADQIQERLRDYKKVLNYDLFYCGLKETSSKVGFRVGSRYYVPVYVYRRSPKGFNTYNFFAIRPDAYTGTYGGYSVKSKKEMLKMIEMAHYVQINAINDLQLHNCLKLYDNAGVIIPNNRFVRMIYHIKKYFKI